MTRTPKALSDDTVKTCACGCGKTFMWRDYYSLDKKGRKAYIEEMAWYRKRYWSKKCMTNHRKARKLGGSPFSNA